MIANFVALTLVAWSDAAPGWKPWPFPSKARGRAATRGPDKRRACPRDRPPRGGGEPRGPPRRRSARRRAAGWRLCQKPEQPLQVLFEPGGMSRPHRIDRVKAGTLAAGQ